VVKLPRPSDSAGLGKGKVMAEGKNDKKRPGMPKKTYWHLYSLQGIESEKLVRIVNKVLKREYVLIK
jgi:hypothetical protein